MIEDEQKFKCEIHGIHSHYIAFDLEPEYGGERIYCLICYMDFLDANVNKLRELNIDENGNQIELCEICNDSEGVKKAYKKGENKETNFCDNCLDEYIEERRKNR